MREIGVAVGLPEPFTSELQGWRRALGDPDAHKVPPHVTLVPPTAVDDGAGLDAVEAHLVAVAARHRPFPVRLSGVGTFRPVSPVVFVAVAEGAEALTRLAADVRGGPLAEGALVPAFPYHPHVTVAHDLPDAALDAAERALAGYDAAFRVWGLTLFERGADGAWRPQRDVPFSGPVGPSPA